MKTTLRELTTAPGVFMVFVDAADGECLGRVWHVADVFATGLGVQKWAADDTDFGASYHNSRGEAVAALVAYAARRKAKP